MFQFHSSIDTDLQSKMRSEVHCLPANFLARLQQLIPHNKWDTVANTFAEPKPTTFRVNSLKSSPSIVCENLDRQGFRLEKIPWYVEAFILREGRLRDLQETEIYRRGEIYVQSLVSMLPPLVLDPQPGELVLDLTAAPGSKTTQLACLMKGEGRIVANDNNKIRFFKLKANVELQSAKNVELTLKYGESFGREFPEHFDRVLLDAPCSAEGRFNVKDPASYRYWKIHKVRQMARKQRKLLFSALSALRPGGTLVYSTCTFAPEENESVIDLALNKFGGVIELETIQLSLLNRIGGLEEWEGKSFHSSLKKAVRILPTSQMEGFFIARIRKRGTS